MLLVAIDGPAGSGKSTVAKALARRLDVAYLDTGAMYRAVAYAALREGVDPADADAVAQVAQAIEVDVAERVVVDGVDATTSVRSPEVNRTVSTVAANPNVRAEMVRRQRAWAARHGGGVIEGRDIGTVVFPEAPLKVYLTARDDVRAARRHEERDVARRDRLDTNRSVSPLLPAHDALVVDTSDMTVDEVVERVMDALAERRVR